MKELKDAINVVTKVRGPLMTLFARADLDADCDGAITFDEFWASVIKTSGPGFPDESAFMEEFVKRPMTKEDWARDREMLKAELDKASSED